MIEALISQKSEFFPDNHMTPVQTPEKRSSVSEAKDLENSKEMLSSSSKSIKTSTSKLSFIDLLRDFKVLPTAVTRTLFKKILEEVSALHLNEIYHGDLCLENIYIDQEYNISLSEKVHVSDSFLDGVCVDLICLGEILFALCFGSLPYVSLEDERYLAILNGDWELFWALNEEELGIRRWEPNLAKSGVKALISTLLAGQSSSKYDMSELLAHEWMKGTTLTLGQVKGLLDEARKKMKKII